MAANASLTAPRAAVALSFPLRAAGSDATMVADIIPIRGTALDLFAGALCVLILTPITLPKAPPASLVQSLLDLAQAETKIARDLASGKSVDDLATKHSVSGHTVRSKVKTVSQQNRLPPPGGASG